MIEIRNSPITDPITEIGVAHTFEQSLLWDRTYITSSYFWPFGIPPTPLISINHNIERQKNWPFSRTTTQSFCWRNVGMVPILVHAILIHAFLFLHMLAQDSTFGTLSNVSLYIFYIEFISILFEWSSECYMNVAYQLPLYSSLHIIIGWDYFWRSIHHIFNTSVF